ncbi:adhesin [Serratia fonticola]|nr:adhesin [Serratia fonticola]NYA41407.1 adhesin [Serratia fonticola]
MQTLKLKNIAGHLALPLGDSGAGLVPRATGTATYTRYNGVSETLTGTIGLPETKGITTAGANTTSPAGYEWCLPPNQAYVDYFYSAFANRTATLSGTWVIVADGNQKSAQVTVPAMYFGSYSAAVAGDLYVRILESDITLRISTLECTVSTPTAINFNGVMRNTQPGAQLSQLSYPLVATCGQASDRINANINVQFRAITGLESGNVARLSLSQGGGYITGEIDNDVTGSGECTAATGIRFDNTQIKLGAITSAEASKTLTNQVTWRLCSGGSSLPTGPVDAAAEMLVTFN